MLCFFTIGIEHPEGFECLLAAAAVYMMGDCAGFIHFWGIGAIVLSNVLIALLPRPSLRPDVVKKNVTFDTFDDDAQTRKNAWRFEAWSAENKVSLKLARKAPSKQFFVNGELSLLLLLRKNHRNVVFAELEAENVLLDLHGHRLLALNCFYNRFETNNLALLQHWARTNDLSPPETLHCCGLLDRTSVEVARLGGPWKAQNVLSNTHSEYHCMAFQGSWAWAAWSCIFMDHNVVIETIVGCCCKVVWMHSCNR